jgi:hypothetical protein
MRKHRERQRHKNKPLNQKNQKKTGEISLTATAGTCIKHAQLCKLSKSETQKCRFLAR